MYKSNFSLVAFAACFIFISCVTQQKLPPRASGGFQKVLRHPDAEYTGGYDYESFVDRSPEASVTCDEFFNLLNKSNPKPQTIEAALILLKQYKPKFFSHYVLLPQSLSLHESSWSHPRAFVHGGNGKMALTFNGDPKQRGYEQLEVMCFHENTSTFVYHEITFPKEANSELRELTAQQKKMPYVISPENGYAGTPHDCRQCHQTPTRPNWDSYAIWPSSYGAMDDILFREGFREYLQKTASNSLRLKYTAAEAEVWTTVSRVGRYAILLKNATDRPNLAVGKLLGALNGERIVAELARFGAKFEKVKVDFARALYCPVRGVARKSFEVRSGTGSYGTMFNVFTAPLDPVVKRIASEIAGYHRGKDVRIRRNFKSDQSSTGDEELNAVISAYYGTLGFNSEDSPYVATVDAAAAIRIANIGKIVKPLGVDVSNWSMVLNGGYEFEDGSGGDSGSSFVQMLDKPFLNTFFSSDARLIELITKRRDINAGIKGPKEIEQQEQEICDHLK